MIRTALSFIAVGLLASGCAAAVDSEDGNDLEVATSEDAIRANVQPGSFKLYHEANVTPDEFCDLHVKLDLANSPLGIATLKGAVGGMCEIAAPDDERSYRLHTAGTSCGSKIYTGRAKVKGVWNTIRVTDHRSRVCLDVVPAQIVVEESVPTANGRVSTELFSARPTRPVATTTWLTTSPKQCGTNPWERARPVRPNSVLDGEAGQIDTYFKTQGIKLAEVALLTATEPRMVCMACSCPRGDVLLVKAKDAADAARLTSQHGFVPANLAYAKATVQCGGNAWEAGMTDRSTEASNLGSWLTTNGAETSDIGFAEKTQSMAVCAACQCSRGDRAIALAATAAEGADLEALGFVKLAN